MQREIVHGVPYFIDKQHNLYTWDTEASPQHIGSYNATTGEIRYNTDNFQKLEGRLASWRAKQEARARKSKVTNARGNRARKVSSSESSDNDE